MRSILAAFGHLLGVVIYDQRTVRIQFPQRPVCLNGICVDNFVPDEILPLFRRKVPDALVDHHEFLKGRNVEA